MNESINECTDWNLFRKAAIVSQHIALGECAELVMGFISKFVEDVTVKNITTHVNQKPWLTREVQAVLTAHNAALSGVKDALRSARANLNLGVRAAKHFMERKSKVTPLTQKVLVASSPS